MEASYDILVADTDDTVAAFMTDALTNEGYAALCCEPRALTPEVIELLRPALLIMDLHWADSVDTLQMIEQLRQTATPNDMRMIVTATDAHLLAALDSPLQSLGCATLLKPFRLATFFDNVAHVLGDDTIRACSGTCREVGR